MTQQSSELIISDPQILVGKPVIRGTRLTVEYILNLLENGESVEDILKEYPGLTAEDIRACLSYTSNRDGLRSSL